MVHGPVDPASLAVVLVEPQHEGNVGAAARAMGNLGIASLRLVGGVAPGEEAERMACASRDVLAGARRFPTLAEAIGDCALAIGFASPERTRDFPLVLLPELVPRIAETASRGGKVGLVFGREDRGLTREEASRCGLLASIPLPSPRATLNLAQAVLLAGYEILRPRPAASLAPSIPAPGAKRPGARPATASERAAVLAGLDEALARLGFDEVPRLRLRARILARLQAIFERAVLDLYDVKMLRGLATRILRVVPPGPRGNLSRLMEKRRGHERDADWPEQL